MPSDIKTIENIRGWFWFCIKMAFYLMIFAIIIFLLLSFNLVPSFVIKFLRDTKDKYAIIRVLYYFLYAIPCLMGDLLRGLLGGGGGADGGGTGFTAGVLLLLLCLLLLPCIIRYVYLRTPWGLSQLMKTSYKMKLENAKKAVDSLEQNIELRELMAPGVPWTASWVKKASNDKERAEMAAELLKLHYRKKQNEEKIGTVLKRLFFDIARCYITPVFPFYGIYNFKKSLDVTLIPTRPPLDKTLKYIEDNIDEMTVDLKLLPKLKFDYQKLFENYEQYVATFKTKQLINDPVYTDKETTDDDWYFENLKDGKIYNYSYAISCWIFIHEQPPGRAPYYKNYASIFNYGDKPNILYNMSKQNLRVTMRNNVKKDRIIFETDDLPMQKWHNILINYDGGTLDLYIDNVLVASEGGVIPYLSQDKITMGQENGLSGGICNVVYFPEVLSAFKRSLFYESLKYNNPPVLPYCFF